MMHHEADHPIPWIDRLREDLLTTESDLRAAVRNHHHQAGPRDNQATTPAGKHGGVTISFHEARTLLRAVMPHPLATVPKRRLQHAELVASLASFAAQTLDANDPWAGDRLIAGALDLRSALNDWIDGQRWRAAAAAAGVKWSAPKRTISAVLRHQTAADVPALFDGLPADARKKPRRRSLHAALQPEPVQRNILLPIGRKPSIDTTTAAQIDTTTTAAPLRRTG